MLQLIRHMIPYNNCAIFLNIVENDVHIKNISTKYENGKIKVNWILVNSHQHYTTFDEPVTSIIKYKVIFLSTTLITIV